MAEEIRKHAVISDCGRFRYLLGRSWGPDWFQGGKLITWVMLNPSIADAELDDQTVRQCIHYSQREGFDQMAVVNLFAFRSPHPKNLLTTNDAMGPENLTYVKHYLAMADTVVVAWGASRWPVPDGHCQSDIPTYGAVKAYQENHPDKVLCLGTTKMSGEPKHPCRLARDLPLVPWR